MVRVNIERVALVSKEWLPVATPPFGSSPLAWAELLLHELAHAVVLRIRPSPSASGKTGTRFLQYARKQSADTSECKAVAVEIIVIRRLRWPFIKPHMLYKEATKTMKVMRSPGDVRVLVEKFLPLPLTERRAQKVIRWLKKM